MNASARAVAVDVMGGDAGARVVIDGVARAARLFPDKIGDVVFVGRADEINECLKNHTDTFDCHKIDICDAKDVINMDDKPMFALRHKKEASMYKALDLLKNGNVAGVLSCGNTGCLVAGGTLKLRTMFGVDRPALGSVIPAPRNHFVLVDVGANPSTSVRSYIHNAVLGSLYYKVAVNERKRPRVGLLSIGTEEGKGSDIVREVHEVLKQIGDEINYCGLIEGFQLFEDVVDVVVCDGFVGNILLKTMEGLTGAIKQYMKSQLTKNPWRMIGAFLARGAFQAMKKDLAPERYCGAPLLGLNGTVVKSHGSSSAEAVAHALLLTFNLSSMCQSRLMSDEIEKFNSLI